MAGDRTRDARDHDDKEWIEGMIPAGEAVPSSSGGRLQTDLGSREALGQVDDPDGAIRPEKQDTIDNGEARRTDRPQA